MRSRRRTAGRWVRRGLGAIALLSLIAWGASVRLGVWAGTGPVPIFTSKGSGAGTGCMRGMAFIGAWWDAGPFRWDPAFEIDSSRTERFRWWFDWEIEQGAAFIGVPLWLLGVGAGAAWFVLWRRSGHHPAWACARCGYDLRGITGDACPECGRECASGSEGEGVSSQGESSAGTMISTKR